MNHPSDLLVDLVDGSISPQDRAVVEAHLGTCDRCRQDVELAIAGRDAVRALPEPEVPAGLGSAAIAEAERLARETSPEVAPLRAHGGRAGGPAWYRWAGAAAATAALLLVVVVALPNVGGDDSEPSLETAMPEDLEFAGAAAFVEVLDVDLDTGSVQALALEYRSESRAEPDGAATDATGTVPAADPVAPADALACLRRAVPALEGQEPVRLIAARFEGTPAFLGVFLSGPGAGQAPDTVTVWVVSRDACEILSTTQASL